MRQNSLLTNLHFCIIITQENKKSAYAEAAYARKSAYIKLSVCVMHNHIICFDILGAPLQRVFYYNDMALFRQ